ncbi:RNA polymerase sigma factor [Microbacteriaceae bacterium 4G12]
MSEPDASDPAVSAANASARRSVEAVWRIEGPRVIGALVRITRDVDLAEELAQDALVAALEQWPEAGVPRNPAAWLTATAKNRAVDHWRRQERQGAKYAELAHRLEGRPGIGEPDDEALDQPLQDDLLRLLFIACHPVLARPARVALTLRLLGGLSTEEIARAFLVPSATIGQRIARAKRTLADADVPFEVPSRDEFPERLGSVLEVLYLIYNEGYAATAGEDWIRPALCQEALRLGRVLAGLVPGEAEVHALVALMELQSSRFAARTSKLGAPILLVDQDRSRWNRLLIERGLAALARAEALGGGHGPYALQAAIAACHARASRAESTDWRLIAALYGELAEASGSPVVELNRAVAVSMAEGPEAGLELVDGLVAGGALDGYALLPSVRGDLLARLDRPAEARAEFERAAELTLNERDRRVLLDRASALGLHGP